MRTSAKKLWKVKEEQKEEDNVWGLHAHVGVKKTLVELEMRWTDRHRS